MGFLTLKDHVYNYIVDQINQGTLKPGKKINEKEICEKFNISRTPVRETLIQLASEGILQNVPRKGFMTNLLNLEEVQEIYIILGALDGLAAALSCPYITEKQLDDMRFYASSMDIAIDCANYSMYHKQQILFHEVYIGICQNNILIETIHKLKKKFVNQTYAAAGSANIKEVLHTTNEEHKEMVRFFQEKDAKALEEYTKNVHWNRSKAYFEVF